MRRAHQHVAIRKFQQAGHCEATAVHGRRQGQHLVCIRIEQDQAAGGRADPQLTIAGIGQRSHEIVVGQAVDPVRIVHVAPERITVVTEQPALRDQPHEAALVLEQQRHRVLHQPVAAVDLLEVEVPLIGLPGIARGRLRARHAYAREPSQRGRTQQRRCSTRRFRNDHGTSGWNAAHVERNSPLIGAIILRPIALAAGSCATAGPVY